MSGRAGMMQATRRLGLAAAGIMLCAAAHAVPAASNVGVQVQHSPDSDYLLRWTWPGPVDVFVSARSDASLSSMRLLASQDRDMNLRVRIRDIRRPYFALRTGHDGIHRVAERLLPLQGGSNFREIGGYPAAEGRHVRWGIIYRSAAMPKLTNADDDYLATLGIKTIVDLRSVDERQLTPVNWATRPNPTYVAIDYPGDVIFDRLRGYDGPGREAATEKLYAELPALLRQEYRAVFQALLAHHVPVLIYGATGQDRTGIAVAHILSALGAAPETIYADYLLSAEDRTPANEMADVNLQDYAATNSEARFLIEYRNYVQKARPGRTGASKLQPLRDSRGRPLIQHAFEQMAAEYGSVSNYLVRELGVSTGDIAKLRSLYLE